eukprot:COSAG01_NODE_30703_length_610_cov_143.763209_1_plen_130_part_00
MPIMASSAMLWCVLQNPARSRSYPALGYTTLGLTALDTHLVTDADVLERLSRVRLPLRPGEHALLPPLEAYVRGWSADLEDGVGESDGEMLEEQTEGLPYNGGARVWGLAQAMRQQAMFEILLIELQPV